MAFRISIPRQIAPKERPNNREDDASLTNMDDLYIRRQKRSIALRCTTRMLMLNRV